MASLPKSAPHATVTWRPLRDRDVEYVALLEAQIHAAPWTARNFHDALTAGYGAQVAEREGRIVAFGVLMLGPGEAQLLNLSVVPDARREGLGGELLRRFLADAVRLGAELVFLEVRVSNDAAIALYEREGFERIARRIGYYPPGPDGKREDALVMRRDVGGHWIRGV
ncbi:MAG: ribosomal protein S18-alanine N-acetyltransferase [Betaproteobacteria bacterium]